MPVVPIHDIGPKCAVLKGTCNTKHVFLFEMGIPGITLG